MFVPIQSLCGVLPFSKQQNQPIKRSQTALVKYAMRISVLEHL